MAIESTLKSLSIDDPTPPDQKYPITGGCACKKLRYTLHAPPLVVHCCHCTECQCQSGCVVPYHVSPDLIKTLTICCCRGPFAINALVEHHNITHDEGEPELVHCPAANEGGQTIARCKECKVAIWSNYSKSGELIRFVRAGTLDKDPSGKDVWKGHLDTMVHIYTTTKVPWLTLPKNAKTFDALYDLDSDWSSESKQRMGKLMKEAGKA